MDKPEQRSVFLWKMEEIRRNNGRPSAKKGQLQKIDENVTLRVNERTK